MKLLTKLSILMTAVICTMMSGIGFAANEDPLFCACIPTDDDGTDIAFLDAACAEYASSNRYTRWRLRAPQKGEKFGKVELLDIPPCNASINGVAVCQGSALEGFAEPLVCAGAPAERLLIIQ